jgi:hypothetical protein
MMQGWRGGLLSYPAPISLIYVLSRHLMQAFGASSQEEPFERPIPTSVAAVVRIFITIQCATFSVLRVQALLGEGWRASTWDLP